MLSRQLVRITRSSRNSYRVIHQKNLNQICGPSHLCLSNNTSSCRFQNASSTAYDHENTWKKDIRQSSTATKEKTVKSTEKFIDETPTKANPKNLTKEIPVESTKKQKQDQNVIIQNTAKTIPINEEDVLEKFVAGLSSDIHTKKRVYKNDVQRVITKVKDGNFSTKKQGLLLLRCCTDILPDETPQTRMLLAEEIWKALKPHTTFDVDHYNELLRVYLANKFTINASKFISMMSPVKPNLTTYELLLKVIGESGDRDQATEVISNMKANNLPATESIFNSLIVCHGRAGKKDSIPEVLSMMKSLKIDLTADTYVAIARAYAFHQNGEKILEEMNKAHAAGITFNENHIMDIVKTLAECELLNFIPKVLKYLPQDTLNNPSISPHMQVAATQLVYMNQPMAAFELYKCLPVPTFGPKDDPGLHGRGFVRDCVRASMPSNLIALITQEMMASGRNPIALQNAAEAALQFGRTPLAVDLFLRMKQIGLPVRPHYYWPILIHEMKLTGEKGIMNTLKTMVSAGVQPDYETFMDYVLPYVSFASPQNLMKKFQEIELPVSLVLTPMIETLVKNGQEQSSRELCDLFQGKVDAEKLINLLARRYLISLKPKDVLNLLEDVINRAEDRSRDWVGRFLRTLLKQKRTKNEFRQILFAVLELERRGHKISGAAMDFCLARIPDKIDQEESKEFSETLLRMENEKLVDDLFEHAFITHPKRMSEEGLAAHLKELEAKGMNTRGVLRKLLQQYLRSGNLGAATDIAERCKKEGVFLSPGMKAAIFDLQVKSGDVDMAMASLDDICKTSPTFKLDEYKVIDFATLLVYRSRIDKAFEVINSQSRNRNVFGGKSLSMNCWRLLDAVAQHNSPVETRNMFELLTSLGYCQPTNAMLGPLIRSYLRHDDLNGALNEFIRVANKYNKTPLKHEILCHILKLMSDGISEENFINNVKCNGKLNQDLQRILSINGKIHGASDVQITLIAGLAEVGYKTSLRNMLLDTSTKFHPDALMRRCERFAQEKKVEALETIAECCIGTRRIDVAEIYDLILDIYQREDNIDKAIKLWRKTQERDIFPSDKFVQKLCAMAKANNATLPQDLAILEMQQNR